MSALLWSALQVDVPEGAGMSKIRVNVKHDIHGMFHVQSAEMMQEVVKAPVRFFFLLFSEQQCSKQNMTL